MPSSFEFSTELVTLLNKTDLERIAKGEHHDPHSVLGAHARSVRGESGSLVVGFHPDAVRAVCKLDGAELAAFLIPHAVRIQRWQ